MPSDPERPFDALVIGGGFGGLGAALALAEQGARVCLCESLRYVGGCASTFQRGGFRFDAGATLVSGLGPSQLFGKWLSRYAPETQVDWIDPLVELRSSDLVLRVGRDRDALEAALCGLPGAPRQAVRSFFATQRKAASTLWELLDDPTLLPPFDLKNLARHGARLLRYAPLAPLLGRSLGDVLASHGLADFEPLRLYADALCQITVQCAAREAEASFGLAAMDYYYRGTGHVRGGVGALATALATGCARAGGEVRLSTKVTGLRRSPGDGTWLVATRRGEVRARAVVANLLPGALAALLEPRERDAVLPRGLAEASTRIEDAWGAAMLYLVARAPEGCTESAHHLQLVRDPRRPLAEGNHVFVSASSAAETERAPAGRRALTVSTHVPLIKLRAAGADAGRYVAALHTAMRETIAARAPEWSAGIEHELTASPRTFARFVGRPAGAVGGLPRSVGLSSYRELGPKEISRGLWMVGDSVFPGQSALATALGGVRTAKAVSRA